VKKAMFLNVGGKTGRDGVGYDWMSDDSELQRSDAATGNVRPPTVVSRNDGTNN